MTDQWVPSSLPRTHRKTNAQRLNRELPQFFRENPLTVGASKNKHYKCVGQCLTVKSTNAPTDQTCPPINPRHATHRPPQRHLANQTLLGDANYRTPFLDFFVAGPQPLGVTDVGQVRSP